MSNQTAAQFTDENNQQLHARAWRRVAPLLGLVALMMVSLWAPKSEARLDPYYLLRGLSTGNVKPRILFVLDTSGSMTSQVGNTSECVRNNCENTGATTQDSRLSAARKAINLVVAGIGNTANFGLMTFGILPPPTRASQVPSKCATCVASSWGSCTAYVYHRFARESRMDNSYSGGGYQDGSYFYRVCGGTSHRPFPYLRWDDLGYQASTSNNQTGALPSSPIANVTDTGSTSANENSFRKVQWFPEFLGVRVNLNGTTDPTQALLKRTFGDYGNPNPGSSSSNPDDDSVSAAQLNPLTGVWGQDFYYWPYVDGFIGYGHWDDSTATGNRIGIVVDPSGQQASLYAPFYMEGASTLPAGKQGPASLDAARQSVEWLTSEQKFGGVDAAGGTPWTAAIGTIPTGSGVSDNSPFSRDTVASYLKFATQTLPQDSCLPTIAILVTDGDPNCSGCSSLYANIRALRTQLNVDVYVVGFGLNSTKLNRMACAGAGAGGSGDTDPCNNSNSSDNFDTCRIPENDGNENNCAYVANDPQTLADTLLLIASAAVDTDLSSGPGSSANESGIGAGGAAGQGALAQTSISAHTEYPDWRGHVERAYCGDATKAYCNPGQGFDDTEYDFQSGGTTSCPQSRAWDAATCLQERNWWDRELFFNDSSNALQAVWSGGSGGSATGQFLTALKDPANGIPAAVSSTFDATDATNIARFLMGENWNGGYKLPGLANSAPSVIRRIPKWQSDFAPSVGIRDPHCAGRLLGFNEEVDTGLVTFAKNAWSAAGKVTATTPFHYDYQEAVVVGSDVGLVHFFQFNSGNEMFAFLPRFHMGTVYEQFLVGGAAMGQDTDLANHSFGMAASANNAWVYDTGAAKWRHVMVMGSGIGSKHYIALDVSHLTPFSLSGAPLEVLWTTQDTRSNPAWTAMQAALGESWARPAITFHAAEEVNAKVEGLVVLSSGYPIGAATGVEGRYMAVLDAVTGDVLDNFSVPATSTPTYDSSYGQVSDVAVASYCKSAYWGEAQEAYVNDPAGRLFRFDLEDDTTGSITGPTHRRDWGAAPSGATRELDEVFRFPACQSTTGSCTIAAGNKGDAFVFSPAVAALDRFDEMPGDPIRPDQLLLAMASGSIYDDATDGGDPTNDFHSSLYLVRDDHSGTAPGAAQGGISIPTNGDRTAAGVDAGFWRVALTDLTRTRKITPFPGSLTYTDASPIPFKKGARPVGSPLIRVTRGTEDDGTGTQVAIPNTEFYFVEYTIYEPPTEACDIRFRDAANGIWYADQGSTYTVTLRLPVDPESGFDFVNGAGAPINAGGFAGAGLEVGAVGQIFDGDCVDGVCGAARGTPSLAPCDPNSDPATSKGRSSRGMGYSEIRGFSPYER